MFPRIPEIMLYRLQNVQPHRHQPPITPALQRGLESFGNFVTHKPPRFHEDFRRTFVLAAVPSWKIQFDAQELLAFHLGNTRSQSYNKCLLHISYFAWVCVRKEKCVTVCHPSCCMGCICPTLYLALLSGFPSSTRLRSIQLHANSIRRTKTTCMDRKESGIMASTAVGANMSKWAHTLVVGTEKAYKHTVPTYWLSLTGTASGPWLWLWLASVAYVGKISVLKCEGGREQTWRRFAGRVSKNNNHKGACKSSRQVHCAWAPKAAHVCGRTSKWVAYTRIESDKSVAPSKERRLVLVQLSSSATTINTSQTNWCQRMAACRKGRLSVGDCIPLLNLLMGCRSKCVTFLISWLPPFSAILSSCVWLCLGCCICCLLVLHTTSQVCIWRGKSDMWQVKSSGCPKMLAWNFQSKVSTASKFGMLWWCKFLQAVGRMLHSIKACNR